MARSGGPSSPTGAATTWPASAPSRPTCSRPTTAATTTTSTRGCIPTAPRTATSIRSARRRTIRRTWRSTGWRRTRWRSIGRSSWTSTPATGRRTRPCSCAAPPLPPGAPSTCRLATLPRSWTTRNRRDMPTRLPETARSRHSARGIRSSSSRRTTTCGSCRSIRSCARTPTTSRLRRRTSASASSSSCAAEASPARRRGSTRHATFPAPATSTKPLPRRSGIRTSTLRRSRTPQAAFRPTSPRCPQTPTSTSPSSTP